METNGGFYISQIKQLQDRIFDMLLRKQGIDINGSQGRILFVLWREDHLSMSELSKQTSLANNTLTNIIERMVQKGIVERSYQEGNRRQIFIVLSDKAKQMKYQVDAVSQQMNTLFYSGLRDDEVIQFEHCLKRILDNLKEEM